MSRSLIIVIAAVGCVPVLQQTARPAPGPALPPSIVAQLREDGQAQQPAPNAPKEIHWGDYFHSSELEGLVDLALKHNQELDIETQELNIAKAEAFARHGEYLPRLNAGVGLGVEKVGRYTSQGVADEANEVSPVLGDFRFGLTASWETDIWQKLRKSAASADKHYESSVEARNFVVTQIVAEIARSYYELLAIDNALDVLKKNIELQTHALEIVRLEKQGARANEVAVQRFEAEVLKNRSRLFELQQERVQIENRINFLGGRYPQPIQRTLAEFNAALPAMVENGLPSQLLSNRPDVKRAALDVEAAKLDVESAKAAFYPSVTIDAMVGYRSFNPAHIVDTPDSLTFGLGGNLTIPLLNRQGIEAQYRTADAKQLQAVTTYERTLLQAFTDVATQLSMIENLQKSYDLQTKQVAALAQSADAAMVLFQSARADYMEVLLARRDSLDAQTELIETRKRQLLAVVGLYQALGGGWSSGG